jgi:hypothetical protein
MECKDRLDVKQRVRNISFVERTGLFATLTCVRAHFGTWRHPSQNTIHWVYPTVSAEWLSLEAKLPSCHKFDFQVLHSYETYRLCYKTLRIVTQNWPNYDISTRCPDESIQNKKICISETNCHTCIRYMSLQRKTLTFFNAWLTHMLQLVTFGELSNNADTT